MRKLVVNEKNKQAVNTATGMIQGSVAVFTACNFNRRTTRLRMWLLAAATSAAKKAIIFWLTIIDYELHQYILTTSSLPFFDLLLKEVVFWVVDENVTHER